MQKCAHVRVSNLLWLLGFHADMASLDLSQCTTCSESMCVCACVHLYVCSFVYVCGEVGSMRIHDGKTILYVLTVT